MRILPNRADKLALISKIVGRRLTSEEIGDMRKGWEPICLTLILDTSENPFEQDPEEPTYHIDLYSDGTTRGYDRYSDGRIKYRMN